MADISDRELLELIAAQVGRLTQDVGEIKLEVGNLKKDVKEIKKVVVQIEDGHEKKLEALLNGYRQNAEKIDRIEKEVTKQEEIICVA